MDDAARSGFVPIEQFDSHLADAKVVGIERSKSYLTPCDPDYQCFLSAKKDRTAACKQLVASTGRIRLFSSEGRARAAGYVSQTESYLGELDHKF